MPTYGKENFKESNINYLNKDFTALKTSLMNYAKSYFPDTYRDFNETSPGMMLLEMNAYVGDEDGQREFTNVKLFREDIEDLL